MSGPVRIQRKRAKGWKMPPNTVYVGRPGRFGNPYDYRLGTGDNSDPRAAAVSLYRNWLANGRGPSAPTDEEIASLRGKNLACWCAVDRPCHADVLLELANPPDPSYGG
jgi:hypothetical protein